MKIIILTILTGLFFLIGKPSLSAIILEGKILNYEKNEVTLKVLFGTHYIYETEITIKLKEAGEFYQEVEVNGIRFAILVIGEEEIGLLLEPGAVKIRLELDYENPAEVQFEGENTKAAEFVNSWFKKRINEEYESVNPEEKDDPDKLYAYCDQEQSKEIRKLELIRGEMKSSSYELLEEEIKNYYLGLKIYGGLSKGYTDRKGEISKWISRNEQLLLGMNCDNRYDYIPSYNYLLGFYESHSKKVMELELVRGDTSKWLKAFEVENMAELLELWGKDKYNSTQRNVCARQVGRSIFGKEGADIPLS